MKLSDIKNKYKDFEKLTCSIVVDQSKLYPNENITLSLLHIDLTYDMPANTAQLIFRDIHDISILTKFQTGSLLQLYGGYQEDEELIFQGYIHSASIKENAAAVVEEIELYAQDVKGFMMLHKRLWIQKGKKKSTVVNEILQDFFYKTYCKSVKITALDSALDVLYYLDGKSDYDVISYICEHNFYTCFMKGDTLLFDKRFSEGSSTIMIDDISSIYELTQKTTMEDQIGTMHITTCDGFESKKQIDKKITLSSLPLTAKMSNIQAHTCNMLVDDGLHNIEELTYLADAIKTEVEHSYAYLNGQCMFLPQLQCSDMIEVTFVDKKEKKAFLTHVIHHIDEDFAYSEWEARMTKG